MFVGGPVTALAHDHPRLVAALRTGYCRRAGLLVATAATLDELARRAAAERPDIVLVVAGQESALVERETALRLRAILPVGRALLFLAVPPELADCCEDLTVFDGLVSLDDPEAALAKVVGARVATPARCHARMPVELAVEVGAPAGPVVAGTTVDLSAGGAGLLLAGPPPDSSPQPVRFHRDDGRQVTFVARIVWHAGAAPRVRLGVRFVEASVAQIRTLHDLALWRVVEDAGTRVIHLHGELSGATCFAPLFDQLGDAPVLDLGAVTGASLAGLLGWFEFLRAAPAHLTLRLRRVPTTLALHLLRAATLRRRFRVDIESVSVALECCACHAEAVVVTTLDASPRIPRCAECGAEMALVAAASQAVDD